jgi:hypothetical protein
MTAHPNRSRNRLAQYGARLRTVDGRKVVEMCDPNDGAQRVHQYRRGADGGLERRTPQTEWQLVTAEELARMIGARGDYHPILSPLGVEFDA